MDPFTSNLPRLDLHGTSRDIAIALTKKFIFENIKQGNKKFVIVHGIGKGILKNEVFNYLKTNKNIKEFKLNSYNIGETIVIIK